MSIPASQSMAGKSWIAKRTLAFDSSGIRRVFELAATLKNPINLSTADITVKSVYGVWNGATAAIS